MPTREQHSLEDRQSEMLFAAAELWQCRITQYTLLEAATRFTHAPELKLLPNSLGAELKAVIPSQER